MSGTAMKIGTQGGRLPTGSKVFFYMSVIQIN
jgi:hypothetical protein